jgi:lactoylglutathione lyase
MKRSVLPGILVLAIFLIITDGIAQSKTTKPKAVLNHTAIYVKDVDASAAFYRTIIGLDTIAEPFHDGKHAWFRIAPGVAMHIIQGATEKKEYYKNQHTCFSVASVDAFVAMLKKNNITWEDRDGAKLAITTRVDGVKQLWLQDPDGYWIEINDARE